MKKIFLGIFFITALFTFSLNSFAADSSGCDAPEYLGGASYCPGQDYYAGSCGDRVTCTGSATFNCTTGVCVCLACGIYPTCTATPTLSCSAQHRVVGGTTCAPVCGLCDADYVDLTPGTTTDACVSLDKIANILIYIFRLPNDDFTTLLGALGFDKIKSNLYGSTGNNPYAPTWYFLRPTATVSSGVTALVPQSSVASLTTVYKYGSGGDPNARVNLEADWADGAWLADYLKWTNEPARSIITAFGGKFCTEATKVADCGTGVSCIGGVCISPLTGTLGFGQFVGVSVTPFSTVASYETVNNYCKTGNVKAPTNSTTGITTSVVGAHICDASEITNSYNNGNLAIGYMATNTAMADVALINNGPPGYTSWSNDCAGWTNINGLIGTAPNQKTVYGAVWFFVNKFGSLNKCNDITSNSVQFACCK